MNNKKSDKIKIYELQERTPKILTSLTEVWEASVRATHHFLSDTEIERIKGYVPQALCGVKHLIAAEKASGGFAAFMGITDCRLEMLFLSPGERGRGLGRRLLEHGIRNYGIRELTVNKQNPQAAGFYRHLGFETYKRTELDEEGGPYPLLYMKRNGDNRMELKKLNQELSVCKVADYSLVNLDAEYCFTGKTDEEHSLVCSTKDVPANVLVRDDGWKGFRVQGVLDFSLIGILSKISGILADSGISIFALSTYNTDYILIKAEQYDKALDVLGKAGYQITE